MGKHTSSELFVAGDQDAEDDTPEQGKDYVAFLLISICALTLAVSAPILFLLAMYHFYTDPHLTPTNVTRSVSKGQMTVCQMYDDVSSDCNVYWKQTVNGTEMWCSPSSDARQDLRCFQTPPPPLERRERSL